MDRQLHVDAALGRAAEFEPVQPVPDSLGIPAFARWRMRRRAARLRAAAALTAVTACAAGFLFTARTPARNAMAYMPVLHKRVAYRAEQPVQREAPGTAHRAKHRPSLSPVRIPHRRCRPRPLHRAARPHTRPANLYVAAVDLPLTPSLRRRGNPAAVRSSLPLRRGGSGRGFAGASKSSWRIETVQTYQTDLVAVAWVPRQDGDRPDGVRLEPAILQVPLRRAAMVAPGPIALPASSTDDHDARTPYYRPESGRNEP